MSSEKQDHEESQVKESEASTNTTNRSLSITVASLLLIFFGLGIAVANPFILVYIIINGSGPRLFVIEFLHGNTLFWNLWGFNGGLVLGLAHGIVSAIEAVAGFWLLRLLKKGGKLGIILQIPNLFFAVGFQVPILYVLPPVTTILIASKWKNLR